MESQTTITYVKTEDNVRQYLILFLLGTLLTWYIQYLWNRRKFYIFANNIPGPSGLPFIGSTYLIRGNGFERYKAVEKLDNTYPDIWKIWLGPQLVINITKPEYVETVLTNSNTLTKPYLYDFMKCILGEGLITSPLSKWRKHRKAISPSFNQKILNSFVEVFAEQGQIFVEQLRKHVGERNINFYNLATRCTLDIVCQTAMGVSMNVQTSDSNFGDVIEHLLELISCRLFNLPYHINCIWNWSKPGRNIKHYIKEFHATTGSVIRKKMQEYDWRDVRRSCIEDEHYDAPIKKRMAFLDLILENIDFTEEELREQVDTFLVAGTETTAATLCTVCMALGMHQDIQEKMYEEVIEILGKDRPVTPDDLPKMKYTERVIRETMRLFQIAPILARSVNKDLELDNKIVIPAGTIVALGLMSIHRNPKYWPDPLKFDPDRFLPEEILKRHPCTYFPFSFGPRICIGWRYAMLNLKTIIATLIREYRFFSDYTSIEEVNLKLNMVLRLKDGLKLRIEPREK